MTKKTTQPVSTNVVWQHTSVTRACREEKNGHRGAIIWFTGLSGAGKSTLAHAVEKELHQHGCHTFVLDGDNVRQGLCGDLVDDVSVRGCGGKSVPFLALVWWLDPSSPRPGLPSVPASRLCRLFPQ